jgi:hypothetical protein
VAEIHFQADVNQLIMDISGVSALEVRGSFVTVRKADGEEHGWHQSLLAGWVLRKVTRPILAIGGTNWRVAKYVSVTLGTGVYYDPDTDEPVATYKHGEMEFV